MRAGSVRGTATNSLALEQAIVDRELIELVTGGLCDESVNSQEIAFGSDTCRQPRGTRDRFMRRIRGGQTHEPDRV